MLLFAGVGVVEWRVREGGDGGGTFLWRSWVVHGMSDLFGGGTYFEVEEQTGGKKTELGKRWEENRSNLGMRTCKGDHIDP